MIQSNNRVYTVYHYGLWHKHKHDNHHLYQDDHILNINYSIIKYVYSKTNPIKDVFPSGT